MYNEYSYPYIIKKRSIGFGLRRPRRTLRAGTSGAAAWTSWQATQIIQILQNYRWQRPVEQVKWIEAVEFCERLSKLTGKDYRLPSEAEWEYACRAGTTTPFYFGETITTELVNYRGNYTYGNAPKGEYRGQTIPVGQFPANAFGLYDMHGNVSEFCQDVYNENYNEASTDGSAWEIEGDSDSNRRVLRGGSWYFIPGGCRSANRAFYFLVETSYSHFGFRLVSFPPRTLK